MTGRMGFMGNLTAGEIISQIINVKERAKVLPTQSLWGWESL